MLDLLHVLEKLQNALKALMPDERERKAAFDRMKGPVSAGSASAVADDPASKGGRCRAVGEFVRCCRSNLFRMRCDECRQRGIPCGSGVIKGGCRTVVVDRLRRGGSRWPAGGANGIMAIRCCQMNGRVTDFFQWRAAAA